MRYLPLALQQQLSVMQKQSRFNTASVSYDTTLMELKALIAAEGDSAWAAFPVLASLSTNEALELLRFYAHSPDWRYRRAAIDALPQHAQSKQASDLIFKALKDSSVYVLCAACRSAGTISLHNAHNEIMALISSPEKSIRIEAIRAISILWQPNDFPFILSIFKSDREKDVRHEAGWSLKEHASTNTWRTLFETWKNDDLPKPRVWACELARHYSASDVKDDLLILSKDLNGHVRKAADKALDKL